MRDLSPIHLEPNDPPQMLRENVDRLSEHVIQAIWYHLVLRLDELKTTDGRPVRILDRGWWNHDAGPDFRQAKLRIGDDVQHGDVEIHWRTSEWIAHGHEDDRAYSQVILHVVYEDDKKRTGRNLPILELKPHLSSSLGHLAEKLRWLSINNDSLLCHDSINKLDPSFVRQHLDTKGAERLEYKVQRFAELKSSHALTWNELFYYGMMDALGFSKNREPFRKLALIIGYRDLIAGIRDDEQATALMRLQAILMGAGGLLNINHMKVRGDLGIIPYLQRMGSLWDEFRRKKPDVVPMSIAEWKLFRLRPGNFPTLRIAGFCRFIQQHAGRSWVDLFGAAVSDPERAVTRWQDLLRIQSFGYWSDHYWWGDKGRHDQQDLIGGQRSFEMIVNVVLPILKLWSRHKTRASMAQRVDTIYFTTAGQEKNSVIRFMKNQLLPGLQAGETVLLQQGLIQQHRQCRSYGCASCAILNQVIDADGQEGYS